MTHGHPNPFVRMWPDLPWPPPTTNDEHTQTIAKKVWKLADIKAIARAQLARETETLVTPLTESCVADLQKLEFTACDAAERILELEDHHYDKSTWCMRGVRAGIKVPDEQLWFPCDAYALRIRERLVVTRWEGYVEYYLKLSLTPTKQVILLFSFHLPKPF